MEKEFVTYEIGLMLKELGYNEPCFKVYDEKGFLQDEDVMDKLKLIKVLAPLWQDAIDWILEEHNLFISFMIEDNKDFSEKLYRYAIFETDFGSNKKVRMNRLRGNISSLPKAREIAILKALELCKKKI